MNYVEDIVKEKYDYYTNKNYLKAKELSVITVPKGFALPVKKRYNPNKSLCGTGGITNSDGEYLKESAMLGYNMSNRLLGGYSFNKENVPYIDESVIYINHFIHQWGHYLIDVINRLWYILDKNIQELKFVYIVREGDNDRIAGNYLEILELLGIKESNIYRINKVTQFKEIIIPEASIYPGKYYTSEYKKIFDTIIKNANIKIDPQKTIYCSRGKFKKSSKKEIGEKVIEESFNDNGFESVYFEKMSVKEQIQLINNSKIIVSISGTLPHNIVFSRGNTKFIILNKTYKLNMHQFILDQVSGRKVDFVDVNVSPLPVEYGRGPFIIKITNCLKNYFIDNNFTLNKRVNYKLSLKEKMWFYIRYLINNRLRKVKDSDFDLKIIRNNYMRTQKQ